MFIRWRCWYGWGSDVVVNGWGSDVVVNGWGYDIVVNSSTDDVEGGVSWPWLPDEGLRELAVRPRVFILTYKKMKFCWKEKKWFGLTVFIQRKEKRRKEKMS